MLLDKELIPVTAADGWSRILFLHYQFSNVAKPTSASQSNISFLSSLCEVWRLQYVLPASSSKLLCIVLLKWLQKCCHRDTVNCSFCVYFFLLFKNKIKKKEQKLLELKELISTCFISPFHILLANTGFSSPLLNVQAYSILNRPRWQFWTCSIRFQMLWFMGLAKFLQHNKVCPTSRIVLHQDNLKPLLLPLYKYNSRVGFLRASNSTFVSELSGCSQRRRQQTVTAS